MYCSILLVFAFFHTCCCKEYKAVDELDLPKYMGKWYQVYKDNFNKAFQGFGRCSTADYSIVESNKVSVLNQQINKNNMYESIDGYAFYKDDDCCGYLTVKLDGAPQAAYWVLELGPVVDDLYDYSIVSDNIGLSLFVLTRNVDRFYKLYNDAVLVSLDEFGFNKEINKPLVMNQTDCNL